MTLAELREIFAALAGVSEDHVRIIPDTGSAVIIRYEIDVSQATADDAMSALGDLEDVQDSIVAGPDFAEAFVGYAGAQELEAPSIATTGAQNGDGSDGGAGAAVGAAVGVVAAVGLLGLAAFVVRQRKNGPAKHGRHTSAFGLANPMHSPRKTMEMPTRTSYAPTPPPRTCSQRQRDII